MGSIYTQKLVGHDTAKYFFESAFHRGKISHAWLISGSPGIGKETFVFSCVRFIFKIVQNSPQEKRLLSGTHEGVISLRREEDEEGNPKKRDISVEEVRRLKYFFQQTSSGNQWRVAIIDGVENLSVSASNALLKLIEEPPPKSLFFLITSRLGSIQDTIRSRCRLLKLYPLSNENMTKLIPEVSEKILKYAKGSPKVAYLLLREKYRNFPSLVDLLLSDAPAYEKKEAVSHLKKGEAVTLLYSLLQEGIFSKSVEAAQDKNYLESRTWSMKYFEMQKLILDAEHLSLEKEQVLIEILGLLQ
ncbi:hypothetical protein FAI40_00335 [Acetobacteraceae bacterium]|nr:hypothetical protein FAI40_00335 [Acetobacteraceae bacterium]